VAEGDCWATAGGNRGVEFYLEGLVVVLALLVFIMWRLNRSRRSIPHSSSSHHLLRQTGNGSPDHVLSQMHLQSPTAVKDSPRGSGNMDSTLTQRKKYVTPIKFGSELRLEQLAMSANQSTLSEDSV
jgi:hypothetical protein